MEKILLVEDEIHMAKLIKLELEHANYKCEHVADGKVALSMAIENDYDAILLDLMLPGMNGVEVCRQLRLQKNTPIIMLTARDSVMDKVNGLQAGADDYLAKPFAIEELLARVHALLRRSTTQDIELQYKDLRINLETHHVKRGDNLINLTTTEFQLLTLFMKNVHKVMSRDELINQVWGYENESETNIVDVYIRYLRNKIEDETHVYIHTVRGIGYRFE